MKIYEIGTGYTPIPAQISAATEIVVEELTKAFIERGVPVEVIDIATDNRADHQFHIQEVWVPRCFTRTDVKLGIMHKLKRVVYSVSLTHVLVKILKQTQEKIIFHFHNQYNLFFFCKLVPPKLRERVLIAYTNHSGIWRLPWQEIEDIIQQRYFQEAAAMKKADIIFVLNEETKQNILEHLKIPETRITLIGNGVNTDVYYPLTDAEKKEAMKKWDFQGKQIILQVGSIYENKGQLRSLDYLAPLLSKHENLIFAYAGGIVDESYQLQIHNCAAKYEITDKVRYLGMITPGAELNALYNAATMTILPSRYEGFSLVSIEACAAGIPVLVDKLGPIRVGAGSILFDEKDFEAECERMLQSDLTELSAQARENAECNYSWRKIAKDYLSFWEKYLNYTDEQTVGEGEKVCQEN